MTLVGTEDLPQRVTSSLRCRTADWPVELVLVIDGSEIPDEMQVQSLNRQLARCGIYLVSISTGLRPLGPGVARNFGLAKASGAYVFFADIDDGVDLSSLRGAAVYAADSRADICQVPADVFDSRGRRRLLEGNAKTLGRALVRYGSAWRFILRRDFLIASQICFPRAFLAEDISFLLLCHDEVPRFTSWHQTCYTYVPEPNSLSKRPTKDSLRSAQRLLEQRMVQSSLWTTRAIAAQWLARLIMRRIRTWILSTWEKNL